MLREIFNVIGVLIDKDKDVFFDFGAGDGRVVAYASHFCKAGGIDKVVQPIQFAPVDFGDFFEKPIDPKITIAFMNLITMNELIKLTGRITQSCPGLRMVVSARPLPQFEKKLLKKVEPPVLPGHMLAVFGEWDNIKTCTLDEMRRDNFRNIYAQMTDTAQTADETFWIYWLKKPDDK